jgi:hypothetical protein
MLRWLALGLLSVIAAPMLATCSIWFANQTRRWWLKSPDARRSLEKGSAEH